eukprot:TRINITY_DN40242_c0_g1_i1.p1 TRINITY_DN40242_c0_g1~~TRINITY_DN40242_c0_g1_i1.p1  ORF type:complete len:357 (+),score=81.81 TRINITY_DN40242_c0_g1_i1:191-1261(+)
MLWVDKHRPTSLDKVDFHEEQAAQLKQMVSSGDFPHLMVYGPPGAGKKTRVMALLREVFGPGVERLRCETREFETASKKKVEILTVSSNHHCEINPSDVGVQDRVVVMTLIKEIAASNTLESNKGKAFKVVLMTEVDQMTKDAQQALRRTMEKYQANCRIVLFCNNPCKVIEPLRSRCLGIRVPAPSGEAICRILNQICKKEGMPELPENLASRIIQQSGRNLRRAILSLEACKAQSYPFKADTAVAIPDWHRFISETANAIVEQQNTKRLQLVRGKLYELLANCVPPSVIFEVLSQELMKKMDSSLKPQVAHWAAHYEAQSQTGTKPIFHLEAFVAKIMSVYKKILVSFACFNED